MARADQNGPRQSDHVGSVRRAHVLPLTPPPLVWGPLRLGAMAQSDSILRVAAVGCTLICADESSLSLPKPTAYGPSVASACDPLP